MASKFPFSFSYEPEYRCEPGICVFINNTKFTELKNIKSGGKDEESIISTFQKLGFDVRVHSNLTAAHIKSTVEGYSKMPHTGAFFLIISSHGGPYDPKHGIKDDAVCGTDGKMVKVQDLRKHFYAKRCPSLAGIPKVFMIDACRGSENEGFLDFASTCMSKSGLQDFSTNSASSTTLATGAMDSADIMTIFASTQGHVANYKKNEGSYLIQTFAKVLEDASRDENLTGIKNRAQRKIQERKIQTIQVESTFDKHYYIKKQSLYRMMQQVWQNLIGRDSTPTIPITKIQEFFTDLYTKLPSIANAFGDSASEVKALVKEAKDELDEIRECDEVKQVHEVKVSYEHLNSTMEAVYTYLDKVDDLFWNLKNKTAAVIQDVEKDDFKSVVQLIVEINKTIQDCKEQCALVLERCQEFATSCDRAERECRRLEKEAEKKQLTAQVVGGATTAGVAAGGIAASVLVGIFTVGIGTAIGVPLTLAATAATTGAAAATTIYLSHKYGKAAESFGKISRRFKRLRRNIDTTQDRVTGITSLPGINVVLNENVKITCATRAQCSSLTETLKTTQDESTTLYRETSSGRSIAANSKDSLRDKYQSVY
uniref:Caspase family p20 domain-containing protein n=1 Tax=Amphimedon queenslandica TaxID=400682 RepID=A0A1X7TT01_AMPQE